MSHEGGYTRQFRRLWDNPVFRNKQEAAVFSWMKDAAQWRPTTVRTKLGPLALEVGELLLTERQVADDFGLHKNTVRGLFRRMVQDGMIVVSRTSAGTKVRLCNYLKYQSETSVDEEVRTSAGTKLGPSQDHGRTAYIDERREGIEEGNQEMREGAHPARTALPRASLFVDESRKGDDFDEWWAVWLKAGGPNRDKKRARSAYWKARKHFTRADLITGIERFRQAKPAFAEWCGAAKFFDGERWRDSGEPAPPPTPSPGEDGAQIRHELGEPGDRLARDLGAAAFRSWFVTLRIDRLGAGEVFLSAPTKFIRNWVNTHYADAIGRAWNVRRVTIAIRDGDPVPEPTPVPIVAPACPPHEPGFMLPIIGGRAAA
ncbi:MAG TPA: DnaA N-terminal domain-containing protein [Stellaceae bacterium]|jgi:chromosomal replication initiator protein|nr:DnaA N-terminal domain-containing protein [Stellaceae bacterium]